MDTKTSDDALSNTNASQTEDVAQKKNQKVQLDIEDAPFLLASEEAEVIPEAPKEKLQANVDSTPVENPDSEELLLQKKLKKRKLLAVIFLVILIFISVGGWFFFFRTPPPVNEPTIPEPTVVVVPSSEIITGPSEYKLAFEPFMVEQKNASSVHFLQATFVGISKDEKVIKESQSKELVLRDAIYYYLGNKTHEYLIDPKNTMAIKQDLLDIVNGYLVSGKMEDILLENYILR